MREAISGVDERVSRARLLQEQALSDGDAGLLADAGRELDAAEADLAVTRGRLLHGQFLLRRDQDPAGAEADPGQLPLLERAARLYEALGDTRGQADALFWIGCFHQLARRDHATAVTVFERSLELSAQAGDKAVMAEALRHLGIVAHAGGDLAAARRRLEESTRLRREAGLLAGVAANMVGLAYIAAAQGRADEALALISEGSAIARACQADRIAAQLSEAGARIGGQ